MASCGDEFTFTWRIENFSCLPHQEGEVLESPEFTVESVRNSKWCLRLYPRGVNDEIGNLGSGHISLFLRNMESIPLTVFKYYSLVTTEGKFEVEKLKNTVKSTYEDCGLGDFQVISLASLNEKKHFYLPQDVLTVKCCMYADHENEKMPNNAKLSIVPDPFRRQCFSTTRIKVHKRFLTWPIKKIRKHFESSRMTVISLTGAIKNTPSLKLSFSISEDSKEEFAKIEILQMNSSYYEDKQLFVRCKITILTADEVYQTSSEDTYLFSLELDDKWIFPSFIGTKNLTDGKYFFVDDTLILQCEFSFSHAGTEYHVEAPQYAPWHLEVNKPSKVNQLRGSINLLYTSGDLCDVSLHADGEKFRAHRLVLCARSPVFSAMFQNDMKEKNTHVVDIVDVDAKTLERFLRFLHSDILDEGLTSVDASNLYKAADKYQVDLLKKQCSILILSTLCTSNVCDIIVLADAHRDFFLMSAVDNFLQYHFHEVLNCKEWKDFMDRCPKLSGQVMFLALKSKPFL